ncbi:hypothetical protein TNCV_1191711 [Trichonephila clavipes]|nr:hypothetical protein TNCV_1191711 [Trichonephila clavipes]
MFGSGVKSRVNRSSSSALVKFNDAIRHEFSCIQPEMLHVVVDGVITGLQTVVRGNGAPRQTEAVTG